MKKVLTALAVLTLSTTAAHAGVYVSAGYGYVSNSSDVKTAVAKQKFKDTNIVSGAVGYDFPVVPVRAELEGFYTRAAAKGADDRMKAYGAMLNGYARVPLIGLYGGAGIGYGSVFHKSTPLAQGMIGLEYGFAVVNVGLEYRHTWSTGSAKRRNADIDYKTDAVMLKLRLGF